MSEQPIRPRIPIRLILAAGIALFSLCSYYSMRSFNPVTQEVQHIDITPRQEIALGLQAAPEMSAQFGGLSRDATAQHRVDEIGRRLVSRSAAHQTDYPYEFHLLADEQTINAFALPGGQVFMTAGLYKHLTTDGQIAGVLGHEIGHVVARHGAEHMAKAQLTQGLTGAAVLATYDPDRPSSMRTAAVAAMIGQLVSLRYSRSDESEADRLGVRFTAEAGYDPRAMLRVMEILEEAGRGRSQPPEFFSTHPNPERRIERIQAEIKDKFPSGVPENLEK